MTDPLGLGVRAVVNAGGAQSRLGGAVLSPEVRAAMDRAGTVYVEVEKLHDAVGAELATLTRNAAAAVAAGSAAGIMVAVAAAIAGDDSEAAARLPRAVGPAPAVGVWSAHLRGPLGGADAVFDNEYVNSIHLGGGRVRIMDEADGVEPTDAAVVWFPGMFGIAHEDELLAALTARARAAGVPVIVDAADQIPPFSRAWSYTTELGADLAVFSGGKGLGGPTSSGLVVGRADLIAAFRANSGTEHSTGRVAKVGREELVGLLAAVRIAAERDEDAQYAGWQRVVDDWHGALSAYGALALERTDVGHCGQRVPRLLLGIGDRGRRDALIAALWERDPRIAVLPETEGRLALSPQLLGPGEPQLVLAAVRSLLGGS
jgi:seryl-tRNA(Sec) selenium transferase